MLEIHDYSTVEVLDGQSISQTWFACQFATRTRRGYNVQDVDELLFPEVLNSKYPRHLRWFVNSVKRSLISLDLKG